MFLHLYRTYLSAPDTIFSDLALQLTENQFLFLDSYIFLVIIP